MRPGKCGPYIKRRRGHTEKDPSASPVQHLMSRMMIAQAIIRPSEGGVSSPPFFNYMISFLFNEVKLVLGSWLAAFPRPWIVTHTPQQKPGWTLNHLFTRESAAIPYLGLISPDAPMLPSAASLMSSIPSLTSSARPSSTPVLSSLPISISSAMELPAFVGPFSIPFSVLCALAADWDCLVPSVDLAESLPSPQPDASAMIKSSKRPAIYCLDFFIMTSPFPYSMDRKKGAIHGIFFQFFTIIISGQFLNFFRCFYFTVHAALRLECGPAPDAACYPITSAMV